MLYDRVLGRGETRTAWQQSLPYTTAARPSSAPTAPPQAEQVSGMHEGSVRRLLLRDASVYTRDTDVEKFIDSFPTMSYADTDPLRCAALALLRSEDPAASLEKMDGSIGIGSPGSYVQDLLGGRADRPAPDSRRRCVVFAPRKLRELIERELGIAGLTVETPDSVRRIRNRMQSRGAAREHKPARTDAERVDELYNATGREYNLHITRLEFRTS